MKHRIILATTFLVISMASISAAHAQRAVPCSSCAECTDALSQSEARVELSSDLVAEGDGPCVVIRGADARFDGMERDIRPVGGANTVGVRIEADGVLVRNVHVVGADVGIEVAGSARVTLFHQWIKANQTAISAIGAEGLRITRSVLQGGQAGVALGADGSGKCPSPPIFLAPGVVLWGNHIEGAKIGVIACDAIPVLARNTIVNNEVGVHMTMPWRLNAAPSPDFPRVAPWDPCVCTPELTDVSAGTAIFYSSGCHGCQIHEEWLPDVRKQGMDVRIRPTGPENRLASKEFDAFIDRCLPQITDAIGIPGCVPNYGCLANDVTFKIRLRENELLREAEINSTGDLVRYARACKETAERHYFPRKDCIRHALVDNTICANRVADIESVKELNSWKGAGNACATAKGTADVGSESGCERPCGTTPPLPGMPDARERENLRPPPPPLSAPPELTREAAPASKAEAAAPTATPPTESASAKESAAPEASGSGWPLIGAGIVGLLLLVSLVRTRRDEDDAS